jgi:PAS domain-containing protein
VHKLFAQQVAKATESGHLNLERLAELVGGAYEELDRGRRRTDRSMSLMIEEIDAIHRDLENAVIERTLELRAREAELEAQNMRFEAAVSNMNQGLVMFDAGARLVICNQRYTQMYGLKPDSVRPGSTLRELIDCAGRMAPSQAIPSNTSRRCLPRLRPQRRPASSSNSTTGGPSRCSISQ